MATIELQKEYLSLPLRFGNDSFLRVPEYQFQLDSIKAFFNNREGSRIYYPTWGFNFENSDHPYEEDELRALIIAKLDQFFPFIQVDQVIVREVDLGEYIAEITITQDRKSDTITINLQ
jgi:hypothetical protein